MNFVKIVMLWTGVLTWYCGLVLLIARILHGREWSIEIVDDEYEAEKVRRRNESARWN